MHLPRVGVRERGELEIDHHHTAKPPVKEDQVDPVPGSADAQAALPAHEGEVAAEIEEDGLELRA